MSLETKNKRKRFMNYFYTGFLWLVLGIPLAILFGTIFGAAGYHMYWGAVGEGEDFSLMTFFFLACIVGPALTLLSFGLIGAELFDDAESLFYGWLVSFGFVWVVFVIPAIVVSFFR